MRTLALDPAAWLIAAVVIAACWPLAQRMRHERLHPLAAFLLFVSVLALVAGGVVMALVWLLAAIGAVEGGVGGPAAAAIIALVALLAGGLVARWIVRRPQVRRMPR